MRRAGLMKNSVGRVLSRAPHRSMESRSFAFLDDGNPKLNTIAATQNSITNFF